MLCYTYNVKYTLLKRKYLTFGCSAQVVFAPSGGVLYYPAERQGAWIKAAFQMILGIPLFLSATFIIRSQATFIFFTTLGVDTSKSFKRPTNTLKYLCLLPLEASLG